MAEFEAFVTLGEDVVEGDILKHHSASDTFKLWNTVGGARYDCIALEDGNNGDVIRAIYEGIANIEAPDDCEIGDIVFANKSTSHITFVTQKKKVGRVSFGASAGDAMQLHVQRRTLVGDTADGSDSDDTIIGDRLSLGDNQTIPHWIDDLVNGLAFNVEEKADDPAFDGGNIAANIVGTYDPTADATIPDILAGTSLTFQIPTGNTKNVTVTNATCGAQVFGQHLGSGNLNILGSLTSIAEASGPVTARSFSTFMRVSTIGAGDIALANVLHMDTLLTSSGDITNCNMIKIDAPFYFSTGRVTGTFIGINMADVSGASSDAWALSIDGGKSYHGGQFSIGNDSDLLADPLRYFDIAQTFTTIAAGDHTIDRKFFTLNPGADVSGFITVHSINADVSSSHNYAHTIDGLDVIVRQQGTGVVDSLLGLFIKTGANNASGSVGTNWGVYIDTPYSVGSTTDNYGLYIADQSGIGSGLNYAIATFGGDHLFTGNVGIGAAPSGSFLLELNADSAAKPTGGMWSLPSDERLKRNITPFTDGLETILNLNPINYELNEKSTAEGTKGIGVIAQEAQPHIPYAIKKAKDGYLHFDGSALPFVLINAIKQLTKRIEKLEAA